MPSKPQNKGSSEPGPSKRKKSKHTMAGGGKKNGGTARNPMTAKLELPDGYVPPPKHDPPKKNNRKRNNAGKKAAAGVATALPPGTAIPVDPLLNQDPYDRLLPWRLRVEYPKPLAGSICSFNYDRNWLSLDNHPEKEMRKAFAKYKISQLRQPTPNMTPEEAQALHKLYWDAGKGKLLKARLAVMDKPVSPNIFGTFSLAETSATPILNQNVLLFERILVLPELRKMILRLLQPSICDITALVSTCKRMALALKDDFDIWDFRADDFSKDAFIKGQAHHGGGARSNTLVIVPRSENNENPYTTDFQQMVKLCGAMATAPSSFRSIVLDQIPFFNVTMFALMVKSLPNLEEVVITRCLLLDVCRLPNMLRTIQNNPRPQSSNGYIRLDFYPYFFRGPSSGPRVGSFGVTWHEPTFDTPRAVFAMILRIWELAKTVGMDLLGNRSAFWRFVSQLPGVDVLWALKAREAVITYYHELEGHKDANEDAIKRIKDRFAHDLMAAMNGDNHGTPDIPPNMARYMEDAKTRFSGSYWNNWDVCGVCETSLPRCLFPMRLDCCWACKMGKFITDMEDSHLRFWQLAAISTWIPNLGNVADLSELLADEERLKNAANMAKYADAIWAMARKGLFNDKFMPMPPPCVDEWRAGLHRWKMFRNPLKGPIDFRQGGPQVKHPCIYSLDVPLHVDVEFGPESKESFNRRWAWSTRTDRLFWDYYHGVFSKMLPQELVTRLDAHFRNPVPTQVKNDPVIRSTIRNEERLRQNKDDKNVYRYCHARVEDCIWSWTTPGHRPLNLDKPVPDPVINKEEYEKVWMNWQFGHELYNQCRKGFF
ncbi:hypothetical protein VTJ49DRAFT_1051 [Mycothermus thermophilus]|uniref:F-box domain-containing protein n=1 Tax=Humicola insolens TaxID=85995 RepID=A0ABR3VDA7_HUMIN